MAVAGSAMPAYVIVWSKLLNEVVVVSKTTSPRSLCESVINACSLITNEKEATIAQSDITMVRSRMADRVRIQQHPQEE
jgi:hypothetical protein